MVGPFKNKKGTATKSCDKHPSWLDHWEKKTGRKASTCSAVSCTKSAEVGGHVHRVNSDVVWIAPLCYTHNNASDDTEFYLVDDSTCSTAD